MRDLAEPGRSAPGSPDSAPADHHTIGPHSALLSAAATGAAVLSYGCALVMAHLLSAPAYSDFAAAQMLLGVCGLVAGALTPLPLVQVVRTAPRGSEARRRGLAFAYAVSAAAGLVAAGVTGAMTAVFASTAVVAAVGASAFLLFLVTPLWGWLQGELQFLRFAVTSVAEVGARVAFSVAAVLLGWGAGGALTGFGIGAALVLLVLPGALRRDLAWRPGSVTEKSRWKETGDIALTQMAVATLATTDILLVAILEPESAQEAAGYQALSTLSKAPIYVAVGAVAVVFPLLRSSRVPTHDILVTTLRSFFLLALPVTATVATAPTALVSLILPQRYVASIELLPMLAASGLGYAAVTVFATVLLGLRAYRRSHVGLLSAIAILPLSMLWGWRHDGLAGLAAGAGLGALVAGALMWLSAAPLLPPGTARRGLYALAVAGLFLGLLELARPHPLAWLVLVSLAGAAVVRAMRRTRPGPGPGTDTNADADGRLRILHLGSADPTMPGAAYRSRYIHEINCRLAQRDHVTVFVPHFPGCGDRTENGVRYVHVGMGRGRFRLPRLLGYLACLPAAARREPADVVVADFAVPLRMLRAGLWSARPTIGHRAVAAALDPRYSDDALLIGAVPPGWDRPAATDWDAVARRQRVVYVRSVRLGARDGDAQQEAGQ
jgi:O-antigen/teichoic acid export membrane protein